MRKSVFASLKHSVNRGGLGCLDGSLCVRYFVLDVYIWLLWYFKMLTHIMLTPGFKSFTHSCDLLAVVPVLSYLSVFLKICDLLKCIIAMI